MKRHPGLVPISHEHRQLLFAAQVLKRGVSRFRDAPATIPDKLAFARTIGPTLLLPHQAREEALLFPIAVGADLGEHVDVLVGEHQAIADQLAAIGNISPDDPDAEARLDAFARLLEAHVRGEERELFQQLQARLSDADLDRVGEQWRAEGGAGCALEV